MAAPKHITFAVGRPLTDAEQTQLAIENPAAVQHAADLVAQLHASGAVQPGILARLENLSTPAKAALGAGIAFLAWAGLKGKR